MTERPTRAPLGWESNPPFAVEATRMGPVLVVTVRGEVDLTTSRALSSCLDEALRSNPNALVVDLTDVGFFGSHGMTALVSAYRQLGDPTRFGVVAVGSAVERPIRLVGLDRMLHLFPTLTSALAWVADG